MGERPLFKQCPMCQQFSPEESKVCAGCGFDFVLEDLSAEGTEGWQGLSQQTSETPKKQTPRKKRGCLKKLGIGVGALLGLMIILSVIGSLLPADFDDSANSRSLPVPTFTSTPAGSTASETTGQSNTQAQAQPTETSVPPTRVRSTEATPTVEEALFDFVICDRLRANLLMKWGQVPDLIYSDDPNVSGNIEPGDYVRFLMPEPDANGAIWIEVHPHDDRAVGNTGNTVWIDWAGLVQIRLDQAMFTCEDAWASAAQEAVPSTPKPPTATPAPTAIATINSDMNVRGGPGTNYPVIGTASPGQQFPITGKNPAGDWWRINFSGRDGWVYGPLVTAMNEESVKVAVRFPPTPGPPIPASTAEAMLAPTSEAGTIEHDLIEVAEDYAQLDILLLAFDLAGLTSSIADGGPYTIFAPTNAAFASLSEARLDMLMADSDLLADTLKYHVVLGTLKASDLASQTSLTTRQGGMIAISTSDDGSLTVEGISIVTSDVEASNGVIHFIPQLLPDPDKNTSQYTQTPIPSRPTPFRRSASVLSLSDWKSKYEAVSAPVYHIDKETINLFRGKYIVVTGLIISQGSWVEIVTGKRLGTAMTIDVDGPVTEGGGKNFGLVQAVIYQNLELDGHRIALVGRVDRIHEEGIFKVDMPLVIVSEFKILPHVTQ